MNENVRRVNIRFIKIDFWMDIKIVSDSKLDIKATIHTRFPSPDRK